MTRPKWNYGKPEPGTEVIADDLYMGPTVARVNANGEFETTDGNVVMADRWILMPE